MCQLLHKRPRINEHRSQYFSSLLPMDWHSLKRKHLPDARIHGPNHEGSATVFTVALTDSQTEFNPDDHKILSEGYSESVEELPACHLEARNQQITGKQLQLEAKYTFYEYEHTRKRWQHIFYHETRQLVFTAQGAIPELDDACLP